MSELVDARGLGQRASALSPPGARSTRFVCEHAFGGDRRAQRAQASEHDEWGQLINKLIRTSRYLVQEYGWNRSRRSAALRPRPFSPNTT